MDRRLRMTAELSAWLTELGESEPTTAAEVGAALVAVLESAEPSGLLTVGQPGYSTEPVKDDPREIVDLAYQQRLADLQVLRRRVADAATARHAAELALGTQQAAGADTAVTAVLAERLAAARLQEADLARVSSRTQAEVDAFRTAKETAKALFTAAEASLRIAEAMEAVGGEADRDIAQRRLDYRAAEERLRALCLPPEVRSVIRQSVQADADRAAAAGPQKPPPQRSPEPVPGLLELRADPHGSDIRILFAVEPANTVTLMAVLEGSQAISEHGGRAAQLAGDLLTEIRDDGWPADIDEVLLADPGEFLTLFFPADDGSIARRASVLAAQTSLG